MKLKSSHVQFDPIQFGSHRIGFQTFPKFDFQIKFILSLNFQVNTTCDPKIIIYILIYIITALIHHSCQRRTP